LLKTQGFKKSEPGVYKRVQDGWWNIYTHEQDRVAQESQGVIADRAKEHLASSDQGIIMLRKMIRDSIEAVRAGRDPLGIIRDPAENKSITFDSSRDAVAALG
jgi:5,5'-dehydrodivanillate O-demethylase oxygenase subunit